MSTLAATICSAVSLPAALRENFERRGRISCTFAFASPSARRMTTQSPTAGRSSAPRAWKRKRPVVSAGVSPDAV